PDPSVEIRLTSPAFKEGEVIPKKFTKDGKDRSPPLEWEKLPKGTKSFALVCDDPDAPDGTFVHWVAFNLPADLRELKEGVGSEKEQPGGAGQGKNDFDAVGYRGPAPPPGKAHRYFFKLYALDRRLDLPAGATKSKLVEAMKDHILAKG